MTAPDLSWKRIWQTFHEVAESPGEQRAAVLERLCKGDPGLRAEVDSLLAASDEESTLFSAFEGTAAANLGSGERIGPWRIVRRVGQGGMGAVYEGRRVDEVVDQRVAIKILLPELGGGRFEEHFLRERRILAGLDHPNIARFLDAGSEGDRPYLVMEFVEGRPLDEFCATEQVGLTARLALMCEICDAVSFAHRSLVVHRDIKPGNILVTAEGTPKLLDFGIARLLEDDQARTVTRWMTPNYASPEQLRGEPVTTASDVYSLGVVLYELLTGHSPYRTSADAPFELLREAIEVTPDRPSRRLRSEASGMGVHPSVSAVRPRTLQGDLDTIVLTALDKDPRRRYSNAERLADDLRAHRAGFPIRARADSAGYRARKLLRRHPLAAMSSAAVVLVLGIATVLLGIQARRLEQALSDARTEQATAESVSGFLVDLLQQPDPMRAQGQSFTVEELIDNASRAALGGLEEQPAVRMRLLDTLSSVQLNTGDLEKAEALALEAVVMSRAMNRPAVTGRLLRGLGLIEFELGKRDAALRSADESLALLQSVAAAPALEVARSHNLQGVVLRASGEYARAIEAHEEAIARLQSSSAPPEEVGESWNYLGIARRNAGDFGGAEAAYRRAVDILVPSVGRKHPTSILAVGNLGGVIRQRGGFEAARELFEELIEVSREVFGDEHPTTIVAIHNLGRTVHGLGEFDQAAELLGAAVEGASAAWGSRHPSYATMLSRLGLLYADTGQLAEAEAALSEAHEVRRAVLPEGHPQLIDNDLERAMLRAREGRLDEATRLFDQAVTGYRASLGAHPKLAVASLRYAEMLLDADQSAVPTRVMPMLEEAESILSMDAKGHRYTLALVHSAQAECLVRRGQRIEARRLLESSLAVLSGNSADRQRAERRMRALQ